MFFLVFFIPDLDLDVERLIEVVLFLVFVLGEREPSVDRGSGVAVLAPTRRRGRDIDGDDERNNRTVDDERNKIVHYEQEQRNKKECFN